MIVNILMAFMVVLAIPYVINKLLDTTFMIWVICKHGAVFPMDSKSDSEMLNQDAKLWYDPVYNMLRPFFWWRYLSKE